jgi:hypothetical protein
MRPAPGSVSEEVEKHERVAAFDQAAGQLAEGTYDQILPIQDRLTSPSKHGTQSCRPPPLSSRRARHASTARRGWAPVMPVPSRSKRRLRATTSGVAALCWYPQRHQLDPYLSLLLADWSEKKGRPRQGLDRASTFWRDGQRRLSDPLAQ